MQDNSEIMKYMMAADKIEIVAMNLQNTMDFIEEYKIKSDPEVNKVLTPLFERYRNWMSVK